MSSEFDNHQFNICVHRTVETANIQVNAPSKALALQAIETTLMNAPSELEFKNNTSYVFTCNKVES